MTSPRHLALTVASVILGGLLMGYLVAAVAVFPSQDIASGLVAVPDLSSLTSGEAEAAVERARLEYEEGTPVNHPTAAAGTVTAQDPLPGQRLASGSAVRVTLSLGPKARLVPDVVGLANEQAGVALRRAGFEVDARYVDAEENVGQVVSTEPPPGSPVHLPASVRLVISAGPPSVAVPDLITRSTTEAQRALERLGLTLGSISQDSSSLAAPGTVIGQSPTRGTVVQRGSPISVTVAIVPPPATFEDTARLEDSGVGAEDSVPDAGEREREQG